MPDPKIIQFPLGLRENLHFHYTEVPISSAQILTLNSAPVTLVAASGAGFVLFPFAIVGKYTFNTLPYATNIVPVIIHTGEINILAQLSLLINQVVNKTISIQPASESIIENKALKLTELVGDPTAGDGTLIVYLWYINLEL